VDDTSRIVETSDLIATPTIEVVTGDIPDPSLKTWKEFFDMVGIVALKATEAQKKKNINSYRTDSAGNTGGYRERFRRVGC
jgi:hypothetical protein